MWNWNVFLLRYICYFNVAFVNKIILGKEPYCSCDDTVFMSGYWHVFDLSNWFSLNPVQNTQGSFMSLLCKEHTSHMISARQLNIFSEGMGLLCLPFLFGAERKWFHPVAWRAVSPVACFSCLSSTRLFSRYRYYLFHRLTYQLLSAFLPWLMARGSSAPSERALGGTQFSVHQGRWFGVLWTEQIKKSVLRLQITDTEGEEGESQDPSITASSTVEFSYGTNWLPSNSLVRK